MQGSLEPTTTTAHSFLAARLSQVARPTPPTPSIGSSQVDHEPRPEGLTAAAAGLPGSPLCCAPSLRPAVFRVQQYSKHETPQILAK